ncbi:hypothetical protein [Nocardia abscessus]|uniref:hypothetical protein n=1 Tax=Nocardia abscessus TaxID=120957 RepID=UPI002454E135|nr:hypothetical protein [Nocardia abscessus]
MARDYEPPVRERDEDARRRRLEQSGRDEWGQRPERRRSARDSARVNGDDRLGVDPSDRRAAERLHYGLG